MDKGSKRDFQVSAWSYDHLTYILLLFKHSGSRNVLKTSCTRYKSKANVSIYMQDSLFRI